MSRTVTVITSSQIDAMRDDDGLSPEICEAMSLPSTNDGVVCLFEITGPAGSTPIRVSSNGGEFFFIHPETREPIHGTTFEGNQYQFCPFSLELASEEEGGELTSASISVANVDPVLTASLRNQHLALDVRIVLVSMLDTSRVIKDMKHIKLTRTTITMDAISGELSNYDYGAEPLTANYTLGIYRNLA